MVCLPLSISFTARQQAYSQDDIVALGLASEGNLDHLSWLEAPCSSPTKRQRFRIEQANGSPELCVAPQVHQPGRAGRGGQTAAACILQRDRPIARSSWPSALRLNGNTSCSSLMEQNSCNSSMCSSPTSTMTPVCSSPTSQISSMAPYCSSCCESRSLMCSMHSNSSTVSAATAMSESGSRGSCWSSNTGIVSRAAPGGAIGEGIGWVMLEYGGREVLAEYEFGPTLGCGTFGVTRLVTHRQTARPWACKTICKASIAASPAAISDVQHEVAILQHLSGHSGIVQLQGVFEDERNIHLIMELCTGGDLLDYISRFGRLAEAEAADVAHVMLRTLEHCHKLGVVHRDIKPENFLLGAPTQLLSPAGSAAGVLKISDFGVSAFYNPDENFSEIVGTPFYMAPEVLERNYGPPADIWSVGVVVYLMLTGCLPFNGVTDRQIIKAVLDSEPDYNSVAWQGVSQQAKEFVQLMLTKDPNKRAGTRQLLMHPWLAQCSSNSSRKSSCKSAATDAVSLQAQQQCWMSFADRIDSSSSCPGCLTSSQQLAAGSCSSSNDTSSAPVTPPAVSRLSRLAAVRSQVKSFPGSA